MEFLNRIINNLTKLVMAVSAFVVFLITFLQVICRYVLKSPLPWSQDVLRLAFTYMVFWGAAWCVREKGHLNVDAVLTMLSRKVRCAVELVINVVLCAFFLFLIIYGVKFAESGLTQTAPYLPIPMTLYYASIPSAAVLMLIYMVQILAEQVKDLFGKEGRV